MTCLFSLTPPCSLPVVTQQWQDQNQVISNSLFFAQLCFCHCFYGSNASDTTATHLHMEVVMPSILFACSTSCSTCQYAIESHQHFNCIHFTHILVVFQNYEWPWNRDILPFFITAHAKLDLGHSIMILLSPLCCHTTEGHKVLNWHQL